MVEKDPNRSPSHPLKYVVSTSNMEASLAIQRAWNPPLVGVNVNIQSAFDDDFSDSLFTSTFSMSEFSKKEPQVLLQKLAAAGVDFKVPNYFMHRLSQPVPPIIVATGNTGMFGWIASFPSGFDRLTSPLLSRSPLLCLVKQRGL